MQQVNDTHETQDVTDQEMSVGQLLRTAREAQGLSVNDVANRIKFASRQIDWLEADDFVRLPEAAFVRGFVRSYARMLGLDPAYALSLLPATHVQPVPAPELKSVEIALPSTLSARRYNIFWLVGALVVALSLAIFERMQGGAPEPVETAANPNVNVQALALPGDPVEAPAAQQSTEVVAPAPAAVVQAAPAAVVAPAPAPAVVVPPVAQVAPAPVLPSKPPVVQTVPAPAPVLPSHPPLAAQTIVPPAPVLPSKPPAVAVPAPVQPVAGKPGVNKTEAEATHTHKRTYEPRQTAEQQVAQLPSLQPLMNYKPTPRPAPATVATASAQSKPVRNVQAGDAKPAVAANEHKLRLEFDEDAWAEVKDASGTVLVSRMHPAGSLVRVSGRGPLLVVVGNSKAVRLFDNGKSINLEKYTTAEVARVNLK